MRDWTQSPPAQYDMFPRISFANSNFLRLMWTAHHTVSPSDNNIDQSSLKVLRRLRKTSYNTTSRPHSTVKSWSNMKMTVSWIRLGNKRCNVCVFYIPAFSANYQGLKKEEADKADQKVLPYWNNSWFISARCNWFTPVLFSCCSMIIVPFLWAVTGAQ